MKTNKDFGYHAIKTLLSVPYSMMYNVNVVGKENLVKPPSLITSNHVTLLDWTFIITGMHKLGHRDPIHFVAQNFSSYQGDNSILANTINWFYETAGQIILKRPRDWTNQQDRFQEVFNNKRYLGVFPEGTRTKTGKLQKYKLGAAQIAIAADVPIIPVYIHNAIEAWKRGTFLPRPKRDIELRIGQSIHPSGKNRENLTKIIRSETEKLIPSQHNQ